ncbi:MAG TPA: pterin-binding protein [Alphaproteobacteria bacterium]|nr:pterin-binding protein [Alphaproteobacteria bacterium]
METILKGMGKKVVIGDNRPTAILGERINPTGKKKLAAALVAGDLEVVRQEALAQVDAGADILDVNVGAAGVNEVELLPAAVRLVLETVDVPVAIDTADGKAMAAALAVHKEVNPDGKPLINSVNGEEESMARVLPLVAEYGTAVIGLCMDDDGIPETPERRLEVAKKIVARAEEYGIPRENILIDCLALTVGADSNAGKTTLDAIKLVREELGVNLALGASNVSFGLPDREILNGVFLGMAIGRGLNCPIVDAAKVRKYILAADLALGRDEYAMRYLKDYRKRQKEGK